MRAPQRPGTEWPPFGRWEQSRPQSSGGHNAPGGGGTRGHLRAMLVGAHRHGLLASALDLLIELVLLERVLLRLCCRQTRRDETTSAKPAHAHTRTALRACPARAAVSKPRQSYCASTLGHCSWRGAARATGEGRQASMATISAACSDAIIESATRSSSAGARAPSHRRGRGAGKHAASATPAAALHDKPRFSTSPVIPLSESLESEIVFCFQSGRG